MEVFLAWMASHIFLVVVICVSVVGIILLSVALTVMKILSSRKEKRQKNIADSDTTEKIVT